MFEYLIYRAIGVVETLLRLEAVWHPTFCRMAGKTVKPLYAQAGKVSFCE
ncbi:MAG: hypothetical protein FIO03_03975 [Nitrosopumilales archaeon]|nr:hypothetical protein [Nitrosopumilales archaeon]